MIVLLSAQEGVWYCTAGGGLRWLSGVGILGRGGGWCGGGVGWVVGGGLVGGIAN